MPMKIAKHRAASQRLRLRRLRLAMLTWAIAILIVLAAWTLELLEITLVELTVIVAVVILANGLFDFAIRYDWNLRLKDPSLTLPQMLLSVLIALWVVSHTVDARGIMLMLFIMSMMFGMFRLNGRQYTMIAAIAVGGYLTIFLSEVMSGACERCTDLGLLKLGVFAVVMFWMAYVGSYVSRLRQTLNERNQSLESLNQKLSFLAGHDDLTGLPNRRQILDRLEKTGERSRRRDQDFCVAMLDLDNFKQVNDRLGHAAGDEVLVEFARRASQVLRGEDTVARIDDSMRDMGRFGGEEFLALLGDTDLEGGRMAGDRLRQATEARPFPTRLGPVQCTVSIGIARYRAPEPLRATLSRADQALYLAKQTGRNRVVTEAELD